MKKYFLVIILMSLAPIANADVLIPRGVRVFHWMNDCGYIRYQNTAFQNVRAKVVGTLNCEGRQLLKVYAQGFVEGETTYALVNANDVIQTGK